MKEVGLTEAVMKLVGLMKVVRCTMDSVVR